MSSSVPALYALAHGERCDGPLRCYYCGAPCDGTFPAGAYVKDSFTGRSEVANPGSPAVCRGCVLCLRESAEVPLIDGTRRAVTKAAVRSWSWVVTSSSAVAASKAHLDALRAACLDPPAPPFAIVLSDSGQKHLLYRGAVNRVGDPVTVTLETLRVTCRRAELHSRLALCGRLVAATGKPALSEPPDARLGMAVVGRYRDGEALIEEWERAWQEPLSRLAAWLSPPKEVCEREHGEDTIG